MLRQLTGFGRLSRASSFMLLAACRGRAHSNDADGSNGGSTAGDAGRGAIGGSGPALGADGAPHTGIANAGGNAQAGTASSGSHAQAGTASGGAPDGTANAGGNAPGGEP